MRTLFLHPPSYEGFDGGAGSRYQARREVRSFWYPTWLAQPAALVPDSRLVDAPAAGLGLPDVLGLAPAYELAVLHTSSPSFPGDVRVAEALKQANPELTIGFVGAKVAVDPAGSLQASPAIDFVAREEFGEAAPEAAAPSSTRQCPAGSGRRTARARTERRTAPRPGSRGRPRRARRTVRNRRCGPVRPAESSPRSVTRSPARLPRRRCRARPGPQGGT